MRQPVRLRNPRFPKDIYINVFNDDLRTMRREKQSAFLESKGWTESEIRIMQSSRDDDYSFMLKASGPKQ